MVGRRGSSTVGRPGSVPQLREHALGVAAAVVKQSRAGQRPVERLVAGRARHRAKQGRQRRLAKAGEGTALTTSGPRGIRSVAFTSRTSCTASRQVRILGERDHEEGGARAIVEEALIAASRASGPFGMALRIARGIVSIRKGVARRGAVDDDEVVLWAAALCLGGVPPGFAEHGVAVEPGDGAEEAAHRLVLEERAVERL